MCDSVYMVGNDYKSALPEIRQNLNALKSQEGGDKLWETLKDDPMIKIFDTVKELLDSIGSGTSQLPINYERIQKIIWTVYKMEHVTFNTLCRFIFINDMTQAEVDR